MPSMLPLEKFCEEEERSKFLVLEHENAKVAIREYYCANPACPCTDVLLEFIALDGQNNAAKRLFTVSLDTHTWEIKEKPRHADKIIEEFMNRLGKGLKNRFLFHLKRAKEYGGKHYLDYVSEGLAKEIVAGALIDYQRIYGPKNRWTCGNI